MANHSAPIEVMIQQPPPLGAIDPLISAATLVPEDVAANDEAPLAAALAMKSSAIRKEDLSLEAGSSQDSLMSPAEVQLEAPMDMDDPVVDGTKRPESPLTKEPVASLASFRKHDSIVLQMFDLTDLWSLLIAYHEDFWLRPTAVFLSSSIQLHVDLQTLGDQLLHRAYSRDAKDAADWPKGCASMELAIRSHDKQEKHHLLVRAYNMDPRNEVLRALAEQAPAQLMTLAQHVGAKRRRLDGSQLAFSDRNADGLIKALRAKERCIFFEKSCQDRAVMSFVWNLSVYDFTRFRKGGQTSVKLPLSWGNAWMSLYPMGEDGSLPGKASLRLHFENAFYVRGKVRGGSQAGTNLSLDRPGTWLRRNFMDTSEILHQKDAWITLQIVSVQLPALQLGRVRS